MSVRLRELRAARSPTCAMDGTLPGPAAALAADMRARARVLRPDQYLALDVLVDLSRDGELVLKKLMEDGTCPTMQRPKGGLSSAAPSFVSLDAHLPFPGVKDVGATSLPEDRQSDVLEISSYLMCAANDVFSYVMWQEHGVTRAAAAAEHAHSTRLDAVVWAVLHLTHAHHILTAPPFSTPSGAGQGCPGLLKEDSRLYPLTSRDALICLCNSSRNTRLPALPMTMHSWSDMGVVLGSMATVNDWFRQHGRLSDIQAAFQPCLQGQSEEQAASPRCTLLLYPSNVFQGCNNNPVPVFWESRMPVCEALEGARGGVTPSVMAALQGCDPGCHVVVEVDLECPHHLAALMRLAHKAGKAARTAENYLLLAPVFLHPWSAHEAAFNLTTLNNPAHSKVGVLLTFITQTAARTRLSNACAQLEQAPLAWATPHAVARACQGQQQVQQQTQHLRQHVSRLASTFASLSVPPHHPAPPCPEVPPHPAFFKSAVTLTAAIHVISEAVKRSPWEGPDSPEIESKSAATIALMCLCTAAMACRGPTNWDKQLEACPLEPLKALLAKVGVPTAFLVGTEELLTLVMIARGRASQGLLMHSLLMSRLSRILDPGQSGTGQ